MRRQLGYLLLDSSRGFQHRDTGRDRSPARASSIVAVRRALGVAEDDVHVVHVDAQLLGADLRQGGVDALSDLHDAAGDRHATAGVNANVRRLISALHHLQL